MLAAVRRSLSFLTRRQRATYFSLVVLREFIDSLPDGIDTSLGKQTDPLSSAPHGTVMVIAHRLPAVQHADNVYVMEKSRITAPGDFSTLRATVPMVEEYVQLMSFKDRQPS